MKTLEGIRTPDLIRYGLTGIVAIGAFLLIPMSVLNPDSLRLLGSVGGVTGTVVAGIVLGFLIDALKLYQFSPGYRLARREFAAGIAKALEVPQMPQADAMVYFSRAVHLERAKAGGAIFFDHARWAMMIMSSVLLAAASITWVSVALWYSATHRHHPALYLAALALGVLAFRLDRTARQQRRRVNMEYLAFCRENRDELLHKNLAERQEHT